MNKYLEKIAEAPEKYVQITTKPTWSADQFDEYLSRKKKRKYGSIAGAAGVLGAAGSGLIKNHKLQGLGLAAGLGTAVGSIIHNSYQNVKMKDIIRNPSIKGKTMILGKTTSLENSLDLIKKHIDQNKDAIKKFS